MSDQEIYEAALQAITLEDVLWLAYNLGLLDDAPSQ